MAAFSDDFNRADNDSLGANWTEASNDADIVSNQLSLRTVNFFPIWIACTGVSLTPNQYLKVTLVSGAASPFFAQAMLRYNPGGAFYAVEINSTSGAEWYYYSGVAASGVSIGSAALTVSNGDTFGLTIDGAGNNTVIRVWRNPTGDAPSSASSWGGDSTPDVTLTNNPSTAVDSGPHVGVGGFQNSAGGIVFDDFFGGDIPTVGGGQPFARRFGGVPFAAHHGVGYGKGNSGRMWGRSRSGLSLPKAA